MNKNINFKSINVITENEIIKTSLEVRDGKIFSIGKSEKLDGYDLSEHYLSPGFIDQHIHGTSSYDFMDGSSEAVDIMSKALLKEGTTGFLATTMTQSTENITNALSVLTPRKLPGAQLLGVHLEGPFINIDKKGAQPGEYVINPNIELFNKFNKNNIIKIVSIAPELEGSLEFINYCKENDIIVSMAHTNANHEEVVKAINAGAKGFTHAYNAMSPLHHRDIGVVGTMLLDDNTYAEVITDGIHVNLKAVELLIKNKGRDNTILITDSMRAKFLSDGESELGGQKVIVANNEARLVDGTLAGSILKMNEGIRNIVNHSNVSLVDAIYMASTTPAKNLGLNNKGSIKIGNDADLVILDKNINVIKTIVDGTVVYGGERE